MTLCAAGELHDFLQSVESQLPEIFITSAVALSDGEGDFTGEVEGLSVSVSKADGEKCERCWKYDETVGQNAEHPTLCAHCAAALAEMNKYRTTHTGADATALPPPFYIRRVFEA